jgi:hypothetical protein
MKSFIFLTTDGYTSDANHKEINNMQILGSSQGVNIEEAFTSFKESHSYLSNFSFKKIVALEYIDSFIRGLTLEFGRI